MPGKIPGPYIDTVEVNNTLIEYPPFREMDIGARKSGMPKDVSSGPRSLEHVGGSAGSGREGK